MGESLLAFPIRLIIRLLQYSRAGFACSSAKFRLRMYSVVSVVRQTSSASVHMPFTYYTNQNTDRCSITKHSYNKNT